MLTKLNEFSTKRVQLNGEQCKAFAIFSILNYPISFFILHYFGAHNENLGLRLFAVFLSLPLVFVDYWPTKFKKYLPLYWHCTLLYSIPFFATFLLLESNLSLEWLMNVALGLFWFVLLVDWLSFVVLLFVGSSLGVVAFLLFGASNFSNLIVQDFSIIFLAFYMYTYAIVLGLVFSRNRLLLEQGRHKTLKAAAGAIAHEMRTPLATISFDGSFVSDVACALEKFGKTFTGKEKEAFDAEIKDLKGLSESLSRTSRESQNVVTLLLTNLQQDFTHLPSERLSMKEVLDHALESFVFKGDGRSKVHVTVEQDFTVKGNRDLLIHVFFNLLKNSLYFIQAARKGEVFITLREDPDHHTLLFKDTGPGIKKEALPKLFTAFYSQRPHGTGIGLAFCQRVMESMKGTIRVDSTFGEHTTFTLTFPKEAG